MPTIPFTRTIFRVTPIGLRSISFCIRCRTDASTRSMISAIVLAAGKSERMGSPKALLTYRGRTFLENILAAISESSIQNPVVVVGHHRNEIAARMNLPNVIFNPNYEQGMITSFQAGIRALPPGTAGALLFLV